MKKIKLGITLILAFTLLVGCMSSGPKKLSNKYVTVENFQGVKIEKVEPKQATEENVDKVIEHLMEGYIAEHDLPENTELTDEIVVDAQMSTTAETVKELRAELKDKIQQARNSAAREEEELCVWEKVMDNSEVKEYPEERLKEIKQGLVKLYEGYASQEGKTYDEYMEAIKLTEDDLTEAAEATLKQELVANIIAEKFALKPTDSELEERTQAYAEEYGFTTIELLYNTVSEDEMYEMILRDIVRSWLTDRCTYEEAKTDSSTN